MDEKYGVYVKTDGRGFVTAINSEAFLDDFTGWEKVDEGSGVRYLHAQSAYLPDCVLTDSGVWRYKLTNGAIVECTAEEIAVQEAAYPAPPMSDKERIAELEAALDLLLSGVTE